MKVRRIKITTLLFVLVSIVVLIGNITLGVITYNKSKSMVFKEVKNNAINIASCGSGAVDGEAFAKITEESIEDDDYNKVYDALALFRDNAEIEYIYSFKVEEGSPYYIVDVDEEEPADYGEELDMSDGIEGAMHGEATADSEPMVDEWGTHISAYAPIYYEDDIVGYVGVDLNMSVVQKKIDDIRNIIILVCVCSYVLAFVVILFFYAKLSSSFKKLNGKILDLTDGSGDLTKDVNINSGDEFETIAANINTFVHEIRELVAGVNEILAGLQVNVDVLNDSVSENTVILTNMDEQVVSISTNMEECSASCDVACNNLQNVSSAIEAFAVEVGEIHEMATRSNTSANEAENDIHSKKLESTKEIEELQLKMSQASEEASKINEVREIAERITAIASQTRMLSLNAQIEAARAGEQGAGFAVVATQVGELSNEIEKAVAEINRINSEVTQAMEIIVQNSDEISRFMDQRVLKDYDAFVDLGKEYGSSTMDIRIVLDKLRGKSNELSVMIKSIYEGVNDINLAVAESANNAVGLASDSSEVADKTNGLNELSQRNAKEAMNLKNKISKYQF